MAILISIIIILIAFYVLAIVTDGFLVPASEKISEKLRLSSDAAGATLQAFSYSAPEFFIVLIAILGLAGGDNADIGTATIVGSTIFNVLVIIGVVATLKNIKLRWQAVIRDQGFYIMTILLMMAAFLDGKIVMYEAVAFVLVYFIYVVAVVNWQKLLSYRRTLVKSHRLKVEKNPVVRASYKFISFFIVSPVKYKNLYGLTFVLSIFWIAAISFVLVNRVDYIGEVLSINTTFLALIVLAAGTSLLDLLESVKISRQGYGDMAVSGAFGSNIFYILFALGVPWIIYLAFYGGEIIVGTENLVSSAILLSATVISILAITIFSHWKLGKKSGVFLLALYIAYAMYTVFVVA